MGSRAELFKDFDSEMRFFHSLTFWHYSGFGTKLSSIFGFAKSSQIQDHFSIKPNAQIRCSGCYRQVVFTCKFQMFL